MRSCHTCVIVPNLVALSQTVWALTGVSKILDTLGRDPWDGGVADPLETRSCYTYVIVPNLVAVGQTVLAYVRVPKLRGRCGPASLGWERGDPLIFLPTCLTMPISAILSQTIRA